MGNILLPIDWVKNKNFCRIEDFALLSNKFKLTRNNQFNPYYMVNDEHNNNYRYILIGDIRLKYIRKVTGYGNDFFMFVNKDYTNEQLSDMIFNIPSYFDKETEKEFISNLQDEDIKEPPFKNCTINNFKAHAVQELQNKYILIGIPSGICCVYGIRPHIEVKYVIMEKKIFMQ